MVAITVKGSSPVNAPAPRRRKRLLSVEAILDAALALVDETGRLTMGELATRLGSSASSIYHHLPGRDAILEALRDRMGQAIGAIPADQPWDTGLALWVRRYRDAFAAHPNLIPMLTGQTITDPTVLASYEQVTGMLLRGGFGEDEVVLWLSVVDNFTLGSALDLAAPDDVWSPSAPAGGESPTPRMDAAVRAAPRGRERADAAFELGLTALVAGMRAHLDAAADNG
ncbi:transcriptional regulator, TetR family [Klenkia marina]|uniref:Transcriptional regulator, TetR family n=1 Tax=Klenkia marina TaxID=1960309 RepID=A0A1G4XTK8_9ACTN|nr:transcriptional regulator, TetR family [Klenkia marina]